MNDNLKSNCDLFIKNYTLLKENFRWENSYMVPVSATIYTNKGLVVDTDKIAECKKLVKETTGFFSDFRGISSLLIYTMISTQKNPKECLENANNIYEVLRKQFSRSEYLSDISISLSKIEDIKYEDLAFKAKEIYKLMKKSHFFLTGSEDYVYAILFALKNIDIEENNKMIEECYEYLNNEIRKGDGLQSLSQIIVLENGADYKKNCDKVFEIKRMLKENSLNIGNGIQISILALLSSLPITTKHIVEEIIETYDFLKEQKGFGVFSFSKVSKIMYSSILVYNNYKEDVSEYEKSNNNNFISSVVSNQVAITIALYSAIAARSAAVAASSNS